MTDRDHFAAAALTGFASQPRFNCGSVLTLTAKQCYELADAMLRERCREGGDCPGQDNAANLDAVPAVKAGTPGTGDTPKPISGCVSDRSKPITGPDPDSRVWETHTPATHATRGEGSERRECTQEPVAWAVRYRHGDTGIVDLCRTLADCRAKWSNRTTDYWLYEPLYRNPPVTYSEREAVGVAIQCVVAAKAQRHPEEEESHELLHKTAAILRGLFDRTK